MTILLWNILSSARRFLVVASIFTSAGPGLIVVVFIFSFGLINNWFISAGPRLIVVVFIFSAGLINNWFTSAGPRLIVVDFFFSARLTNNLFISAGPPTSVGSFFTRRTDRELGAIILGSALCDGHYDWLVVGGRSHSTDTVIASRETTSDCGPQFTSVIASVINALEEGESGGIKSFRGRQIITKSLNGNMHVANNIAVVVDSLRRRIVSHVRVGEFACIQICHLEYHFEVLVLIKVATRWRVRDNR